MRGCIPVGAHQITNNGYASSSEITEPILDYGGGNAYTEPGFLNS
jgi:hypothetical protein